MLTNKQSIFSLKGTGVLLPLFYEFLCNLMIAQKGTKTLGSTIINIQPCRTENFICLYCIMFYCICGGDILYTVKQSHLFLFTNSCVGLPCHCLYSKFHNWMIHYPLGCWARVNLYCGDTRMLLPETASFNLSSWLRRCLQLRCPLIITFGTASGTSLT
jgi:hypothetical protein